MELSYILGNGNPPKNLYILGNGSFLYFRKQKPKKTYISGSNFPISKNKKNLLKKFLYLGKWNF